MRFSMMRGIAALFILISLIGIWFGVSRETGPELEVRSVEEFVHRLSGTPEIPNICAPTPNSISAQTIVDLAIAEWARFGFGVEYLGADLKPQPRPRQVPSYVWKQLIEPDELANYVQSMNRTNQSLDERSGAVFTSIASYWSVTEDRIQSEQRRKSALARLVEGNNPWPAAWSAAFTSWIMCEAGVPAFQFPRSAAHRDYVRLFAESDGSTLYLISEIIPEKIMPGDFLCKFRDLTWADLRVRDQLKQDWRIHLDEAGMHCDVVVVNAVSSNYIGMIGGNVRNSVLFQVLNYASFDSDKNAPFRVWLKLNVDERLPDAKSAISASFVKVNSSKITAAIP